MPAIPFRVFMRTDLVYISGNNAGLIWKFDVKRKHVRTAPETRGMPAALVRTTKTSSAR